ncbi:MAG TPA: type II secretion system protein [Pyrinomonadaceae bacterium]|nr:type II secretion system protein [Pyrinomonadaceae bacterium]
MRSPKYNEGFSLIELILVAAVIGILSAIAVPNLLSSRRSANEASALSTVRTISSGEDTYRVTAGGGNYGSLSELATLNFVDAKVGAATIAGPGSPRSGYLFSAANIPGLGLPAFDVKAQAFLHTSVDILFATGTRSFYVNEGGLVYFNPTPVAPTCSADDSRTVAPGVGGAVLNNNN